VHPVEARKGDLLLHVLTQPPAGQALVFCRTKRGSNRVGRVPRAGRRQGGGDPRQQEPGRADPGADDFKAGRVTVLVATDIAARGLDIDQLPLVVNFDLPMVAEDYVHRVGRTGRAGLPGRAVSLVSPTDRDLLKDIRRILTEPLEEVAPEGFSTSSHAVREVPGDTPRRFGQGHGRNNRGPSSGARAGGRPKSGGGGRPAAGHAGSSHAASARPAGARPAGARPQGAASSRPASGSRPPSASRPAGARPASRGGSKPPRFNR
jgi:ATP-dependent RNA helicase RhlE